MGFVLTDYYFPESNDFFNYDDDGKHILEFSVSLAVEAFSLMGAYNFWGDSNDSFYIEAGYEWSLPGESTIGVAAGLGDGIYSTDTDPNLVNLSLAVGKGAYSASYILNAEAETSFLMTFGYFG